MRYDVLIVGAGHNGLVAAAILAGSGKRVLVLEQRAMAGGAATTEEVFPGYFCNTGSDDAGLFRPFLIQKLALEKYGLTLLYPQIVVLAPQPTGRSLALYPDQHRSQESIARFSQRDAERFPEYVAQVEIFSEALSAILQMPLPEIFHKRPGDLLAAIKLAFRLRSSGGRHMMAFLRALPMPARDFLDEWFESDILKGVLGFSGTLGSHLGPYAAGTAYMMLYHMLGSASHGIRSVAFVQGGIGKLSEALVRRIREHRGEVRTGQNVQRILVENDTAIGVQLQDGETIRADAVLTCTDPRRTFFDLIGPAYFSPEFNRQVRRIKYRGTTAKILLALDDLPALATHFKDASLLQGHIVICPSLEQLERAHDDAKYGRFSENPCLDIIIPTVLDPDLAPVGKHIMSVTFRYAPYDAGKANCAQYAKRLLDKTLDVLEQYFPDVRKLVVHSRVISAMEYEKAFGWTEGSIFQGQMGLDQIFFMRPMPGWAQYATPIRQLYLCGAGTHPGGGITGMPGFLAAQIVQKLL